MKEPPPPIPPKSNRPRRPRFAFYSRDSELPQVRVDEVEPHIVRRRRLALGVLLLLSFLSVIWLAAPVWMGIIFGALMAFTAQPIYRRMCSRLGTSRPLAAAITTIITGILWSLSGAFVVYVLTSELFSLIELLQEKLQTASLEGVFGRPVVHFLEQLGVNREKLAQHAQAELGRAMQLATSAAGLVIQTSTNAMLGLVIGCITMYYVLLEWPSIPVRLERVLPLDPRHTRALVLEFRDVGRSALVGTVATALLQGVLGTVGYIIFQVPHPVTWGLCTALASFIPLVGTAIVWIPVSLYLIGSGHPALAIMVSCWGIVLILGLGDYVVRPRMVGRGGRGQPLLTLVGLLGGVQVFGLPGLVVGPVLMALFVAIWRIYEREVDPLGAVRPVSLTLTDEPMLERDGSEWESAPPSPGSTSPSSQRPPPSSPDRET